MNEAQNCVVPVDCVYKYSMSPYEDGYVYCVRDMMVHGDAGRGSEGETGEWSG